jgi:serine phosphatase RsbU (regulator of sigma subunit)
MGAGQEAATASNDVIKMLDKLLISGFNNNIITKIINSMMKLRSDSDITASLDMTVINTSNNKIRLIKMGAAPTYIISNAGVKEFVIDNMPVGALDEANEYEYEVDIDIPMIIVNISDGAYSKDLKEYFEYIAKKNLAIMSKKEIISGISERIDKDLNDDITIIVTKVE